MSKRVKEGAGDVERGMAKSQPMMNLVSKTVERSSTSSASSNRGTLRARSQNLGLLSTGRPVATEKTRKVTGRKWLHNFRVSEVKCLEKVHSNLRQKIDSKPDDEVLDTNENSLMWGMFMTVTMNAAVQLGQDNEENLHCKKKERKESETVVSYITTVD